MIVTNDASVGIQDGVVNESPFMFLYEKVSLRIVFINVRKLKSGSVPKQKTTSKANIDLLYFHLTFSFILSSCDSMDA